jgi:hypothetical protein
MVTGVRPAPLIERGEGQHTGDVPEDSVRFAGREERSMTAIMKNNKDPHQETCSQNHQRNYHPKRIPVLNHWYNYHPKSDVRDECIEKLYNCRLELRLNMLCNRKWTELKS